MFEKSIALFAFLLIMSQNKAQNIRNFNNSNAITKPIDVRQSAGFCLKYKCECPEPAREIRCQFNAPDLKSIDFVDPSVSKIDFSDNNLEMFVFGDTTLNVNELILRNNSVRVIHENMFVKMPHLRRLDLSQNKISTLEMVSLESLNVLEYLNFSKSFSDDFQLTRELCKLYNLRVLDLSYANLESFRLECGTIFLLVELYMRFTKNADKLYANWLPYIGSR
jgi:hypothetical protein